MQLQEVLEKVHLFYSDTSRPREETLDGLQKVQEAVTGLVQSLEQDVKSDYYRKSW